MTADDAARPGQRSPAARQALGTGRWVWQQSISMKLDLSPAVATVCGAGSFRRSMAAMSNWSTSTCLGARRANSAAVAVVCVERTATTSSVMKVTRVAAP